MALFYYLPTMQKFPTTPIDKKDNGLWNTFWKFIVLNIVIALVIVFSVCPSCFLSWDSLTSIIPEFFYSFTISMALSYGGSRIEDFYDQRISWIAYPVKRLFSTIITYLIYSFTVSFIIVFFFSYLQGQFSLSEIPWFSITEFTAVPMKIAFILMAFFVSRSWLLEWRKSAIEAEKLRSEKLASQYQGLKDQLNPHFLFNSLNVLSNLVYEDANRSAAFIQKLSRIYRYVLDVQQEELVSLEKELSFASNYLELQKIRFEESLEFKLDIKNPEGFHLPPLSLQLLLENAIKHNIASQENPLFIYILQKDDELWVSNTFQPKSMNDEPSKGIGLENIRLRYKHLSQKNINVSVTENEYLVQLPLLKIS
jgi:hypothetical protein